ncbi:hypothetical protein DV736_g4787, partial [Chaetothyriales sp. CBS 134916]
MPQYKFIPIEGQDGKPAKLTGDENPLEAVQALQDIFRVDDTRAQEFEPLVDTTVISGGGLAPLDNHYALSGLKLMFSFQGSKQPPVYRIESICASAVDPFDSLPIPTNPNVDRLVRCLLVLAKDPDFATANRRRSWFPYALQSAPMMHSTLAMTAALWRAANPTLESSIQLEGIHQKGQAMRKIIAWLAQLDTGCKDDNMTFLMSSMSTLVIAEVLDDNFEAAQMHLRGVQNLFISRGGRDNFIDDFILCKAINLADIQVAAALGHRLRFPLLHADHPSIPKYIVEYCLNLPFDPSVLGDDSCGHFRIFAQLRQLLLVRESSTLSLETLRTLFNVLEGSILQQLYRCEDATEVKDSSQRSRALVLAAHVFMYVTLRRVPANSPVVRRMCARLQRTVALSLPSSAVWTINKAALLWIAFVGLLGVGDAARTGPEGQWFLDLFHSTVKVWLDDARPELGTSRKALSAFLWDETHYTAVLRTMAGDLVLLTGGTGFLGHAILIDLLKSGYRVRVAARSQAKIDKVLAAPSIAALDPTTTKLMFVIVPDMTTPGAYDDAVQGVDFIIHAAAPLHSGGETSDGSKEELERLFVTTCVNGNLAILKAANEKSKTVRRIVITSSTVAIAPVEVYLSDTKERKVLRGPEGRVTVPPPPYNSELEAYCVSKAAALNASEDFMRDNTPAFDLVFIMPSLVFGADELATRTDDLRTGSTQALLGTLRTDVARAHVKALDDKVEGNQAFILSVDAKWEDTVPTLKRRFPHAFSSGLFREDGWQPAVALQWDTSKTREILDMELAPYENMLEEVVGQYLELAKREGK